MNHVNLIGKIASEPRLFESEDGNKTARFTMTTAEMVLNKVGESVSKQDWHSVYAWGKWARIIEELGQKGLNVAIEGKLKTRFFVENGKRRTVAEVEINDLIIL